MAYTPEQIKAEGDRIIAGGGTWQDVANKAQQTGVDMTALSGAYGKTADQGAAFAQQQGVNTSGIIAGAMAPAPTSSPQTYAPTGSNMPGSTQNVVQNYQDATENHWKPMAESMGQSWDDFNNGGGAQYGYVPGARGYVGPQDSTFTDASGVTVNPRTGAYAGNTPPPADSWYSPDQINRGAVAFGAGGLNGYYAGAAPGQAAAPAPQTNAPAPATTNPQSSAQIQQWLSAHPGATDAEMRAAMDENHITPQEMADATGQPLATVQQRYNAAGGVTGGPATPVAGTVTNGQITDWLSQNKYNDPTVPYAQRIATIIQAQQQYGVSNDRIAQALSESLGQTITPDQVQRYLSGQQDYFATSPAAGTGGGSSGGGWTTTPSGAAMLPDPATWTVTPEQTVEGRIARLIDPNNPMNVAITGQVNDAWNSRGLVNSGMAVGAAQDAIIKNAMGIATPDAATAAKAAGYNVDQSNQFTTHNADAENTFRLNEQQRGSQYAIAQLQADTQRTIASLNIDAQRQANQLQQDNQTLLQTNSSAAQAFNSGMSLIANINASTTMDGPAKTQAIAQVYHDLQAQFSLISTVSHIDLNLNLAGYPGFDAQGNWIGFPAGAPAATPAPAPAVGGGSGGSGV